MIILHAIAFIYLSLGAGLFMYIGAMGIKRELKTLPMYVKIGLAPFVFLAYIYDIIVLNFIIGTIYFQEAPRELTLSERLDRWSNAGSDNKNLKAGEICRLLNKFDPSGHHCGKKNDS